MIDRKKSMLELKEKSIDGDEDMADFGLISLKDKINVSNMTNKEYIK